MRWKDGEGGGMGSESGVALGPKESFSSTFPLGTPFGPLGTIGPRHGHSQGLPLLQEAPTPVAWSSLCSSLGLSSSELAFSLFPACPPYAP